MQLGSRTNPGQESRLYLTPLREGQPVYNFALARVRYRSLATTAPDVRVFFRLFTTSVTSMAYAIDSYPRNAAETLPTVGQSATDIFTIPCFGVSRDSVETTGGTVNTKPVPPDAGGDNEQIAVAPGEGNERIAIAVPPGEGTERPHAHSHPAQQDELMIQWGGVPEDAEATLFLPALDADAILGAAALRSGPQRLDRIDAHTIRCRVSDVSYIPLPAPAPMHIAGLITIRLPESVKTGQRFRVVVRQLGGFPRHVVGTFELFISVSTSEAIRPEEERTLSVLKPLTAPWASFRRLAPLLVVAADQ